MKKAWNSKIIGWTLIGFLFLIVYSTPVMAHASEMDGNASSNTVVEEGPINILPKIEEILTENEQIETAVEEKTTINKIPLFNQQDYPEIPYGKYGTLASHGCGIVSVSMVATYLTDTIYAPDELAVQFADYNTAKGSIWALFKDSAEVLGIPLIKSEYPNAEWYDWELVYEALQNGQPVICLQHEGIFTGSGHFIVLTGISEDGLIKVNDPNGFNWFKNEMMTFGFKNGWTEDQIRASAACYWVYGEKTTSEDAMTAQNVE